MSQQLKEHSRYGLGKAVGYKATHLYAKWILHTFPLIERKGPGWGPFGSETPFDSNAGRVLWRTGFLLEWATLREYVGWRVIQRGKGKKGTDYIRVTNIREKKSQRAREIPDLWEVYCDLVVDHLLVLKRPSTVEIQRIPLAFLLMDGSSTPGEPDDGLMHIGTEFCRNHAEPLCPRCPIHHLCQGYQENRILITNYRT